jgi:hypothetical protein
VFWAIGQGFAAAGEEKRARAATERARSELQRFCDRIEDDTMRAAFLALPVNRRIAESA